MKIPTSIAVIAVTVLMSGCSKKDTRAIGSSNPHPPVTTNYSLIYTNNGALSGMSKQIDLSQVVAYGGVDTNDFPNCVLTVSEIWKGVGEATALGITNGTHFPFRCFATSGASLPGGHFLDHAIVIIPHADSPSVALQRRSIFYVYDGRFLGMTIQEYKAKFGL